MGCENVSVLIVLHAVFGFDRIYFRFWTIFPTVLQFSVGPNAPLFTDFIFTAEISHTYTELFSVEQSCVSLAITLQYFGIDARTRFLMKLSHKLIISF